MKIEGQNIRDILRRMPWQYKIVVAASILFILYAVYYLFYAFIYLRFSHRMAPSTPVIMSGATQSYGMLDPSLAYDPQKGLVWMAFTSQERAPSGSRQDFMSVRLADTKADAKPPVCKDWDMARESGFAAKNDSILAPDGQTVLRDGVWRIETPSLVYDPDDKGREWKLFAYKYFWPNDTKDIMSVARHYGVIVYKYAADPAGDWSTEQWLFSPADGYPPPPYQQTILLHLNRLDPSLQNVTTYARPSVIYKDGILMMTLSAFTATPDGQPALSPDKIIMIASLDHGNSWRYIGTVLQQSDVAALDPTGHINGAALLEQNGAVYLAAVLGNAQKRGVGTFIFGFDDLAKGRLMRDATGAPAILNQVPLQSAHTGVIGGGSAAYSDACKSGMLVTVQKGNNEEFSIYRTRFKPTNNQ